MFLGSRSDQLFALSSFALLLNACGARGEGKDRPGPAPLATLGPVFGPDGGVIGQTCTGPLDCPFTDQCFPRACIGGFCEDLEPISCDDGDPCTVEFCHPEDARCSVARRTYDEDGDGFFSPLPGTQAGDPAACGNDCDDTRAQAFPGGREVCDGTDNDCNGVVDDNFEFLPPMAEPTLVSAVGTEGGLGGIAHNGSYYGLSYSSRLGHNQNQLLGLDPFGQVTVGPIDIARVNSDTYAGPLIWTGNVFATAWEDRRDDNFEVYFNRLDGLGNKLGPDVRVSNAIDFSLDPALQFTGAEYVVVWGDRRDLLRDFRIYGQRISRTGELLSEENLDLTPEIFGAESPALALAGNTFGLVFNSESGGRRINFRSLGLDLALGAITEVSGPGGVGGTVVPNAGQFVVAWHEYAQAPGDAIWGAVVSTTGQVLVPARRVTEPAPFARGHQVLALGDRLLLVWSEYRGTSYNVYSRFLSPTLDPLTEPMQITFSSGDALGPSAAFGAGGEVGILYNDYSSGRPQVYFTSLTCR